MRRCRNRKNGIQNNKETGAIGCILSRRFLLLFVFPVPDKDTAKKTVDKYKVGVCFLNGTLERYISEISDSLMRQIFTYRFVNGLSWDQVAAKIGGNTGGSVKKMCYRYLKKS